MRINLSRFKKTREDHNTATLKDDRGHEITLSKKALRPNLLKTLAQLPVNLAEGGELYNPEEDLARLGQDISQYQLPAQQMPGPPPPIPQDFPKPTMGQMGAEATNWMMAPAGQEPPPSPYQQAVQQYMNSQPLHDAAQAIPASGPMQMQQGPMNAGQAPPPESKFADPYDTYMGGINQQAGGHFAEAREMKNLAARQAPIYHEIAESQKAALTHFNEEANYVADEHRRIVEDVRKGMINPNHYMESMDSDKRSRVAIGVALSGLGAGWGGKENMAMKWVNGQIDRDIDAQKRNLGAHENLLSANLNYYKNSHDALTATRAQLQEIKADQIMEEATKSAYPFAMAKANIAAGALKREAAGAIPGLAMARMQMKYLNQNGMPGQGDQGQNPSAKIRQLQMMGMIKPEQAEHAYKQLQEAQNMDKMRNNALSIFDQVSKINTAGNRLMNPIQSGKQIDALVEPLIAQLSKETAGRFTEQDADMLRHLVKPDTTANAKTMAIQRSRLNQIIAEKMNFPELEALGIKMGNSGRFAPTGEARFKEGAPVKPK